MARELAKEAKWYRLDNAAKIYPVVASAKNSGIYRMGVIMKEKVDPVKLQEAVLECRHRFPSFFVRLRRGLFWYYFEANDKDPEVAKESPFICQSINIYTNNHFLFTFFYYENRISLEAFHSLADGSGAMEFLKAVLFQYLGKMGHPQENDGTIFRLDEEPSPEELEDSYNYHYKQGKQPKNPFVASYRVQGKRFVRRGIGLTVGRVETVELQALAAKHNVAFTEFIVGLFLYAIITSGDPKQLAKRPITITVPVNMRKYFHSRSVRNFSLFFRVRYQMGEEFPTLSDLLTVIKNQFQEERSVEKLQLLLNMNVMFERSIFVKLLPLFIKKFVFKVGYAILGDLPFTSSVSNFGLITLPDTMSREIDSFEFNIASGKKPGMAVTSFNNITAIAINRCIAETAIEETFFSYLGKNGVNVNIRSNYWL